MHVVLVNNVIDEIQRCVGSVRSKVIRLECGTEGAITWYDTKLTDVIVIFSV